MTLDSKVLIITYVFPPVAYVGVYRTLKYCKYLGDYGWTALVLTSKPIGVTFKDENLCRQVPGYVQVHRTFDIDPAKWEAKLAEWQAKRSRSAEKASDASAPNGTAGDQAPDCAPGMWTRMKRLLKTFLTDSPDSHIFWVPLAFLRGVRILLKEKVDVIYCSSPPHSSHIIAFLLAKCFRKPYVLDFRDPWLVNGSRQSPSAKFAWVLRWETLAKRAMVRRAAKVISVSSGELEELRGEFPELKGEHFTFITNGFDSADFSGVGTNKKSFSKLILTHAGTIYPGIAGEFFEALQQLVRDHPGVEDRIQVRLLGEIADEYAETVRTLEACGIVQTYGLQPHVAALQIVSESDVLVILMGGDKYLPSHIPSKVFEYLQAGKPILAVAKDGELTEIVNKSGLGIVVSPESIEKLAKTLWELYADHAAGRLARVPNHSYIRSFERTALTQKLATILDEVKAAHTVCP